MHASCSQYREITIFSKREEGGIVFFLCLSIAETVGETEILQWRAPDTLNKCV